jgi:hypothetical protein
MLYLIGYLVVVLLVLQLFRRRTRLSRRERALGDMSRELWP